MTSIIKVDQIQTAAGGVPTAADLGLNVTDTILQVKRSTDSVQLESTSSSFSATGLSVSITPRNANSVFLLVVSLAAETYGSNSNRGWKFQLVRNGSGIYNSAYDDYNSGNASQRIGKVTMQYEDAPSTTSTITYTVNFASTNTDVNAVAKLNRYGPPSHLTVYEIAG